MIALLLVAFQSPAPAPVAPVPEPEVAAPAPEPQLEPWDGSFAEGLREVRRRAEAGELDAAVQVAERLAVPNALARRVDALVREPGWRARAGRALESTADALDLLGPPPAVRAEAQHARGVALRLAAERAPEEERALWRERSQLAFESARLLAGPGVLRLDATYDQGRLALDAGEEQRAKLPEIAGQNGAQPPPAAAPAQGAPPPPDPLQLARAAYLAARERFVERLRMDWRDADTQACVELVQRRLRELDEIEKKREEEKKKQEEQKKDEQQKKDDEQKQDQKDEKKPDEQKPDDPKPQDPEQDKPKPDEPKPDEKKPDEPKPEDKPAPEPKPSEPKDMPNMSKEEMLQLLDRLERIEAVQKELQEKLKRMRKVGVEKDW